MEEQSLWDEEQSRCARDEAIERVDVNAEEDWKVLADRAIAEVAKSKPTFTTDDVWELLEADGAPEPHERRAMGPRMLKAVKDGVCVPTDRYQPTRRVAGHAGPRRVYRASWSWA